MRVQQGRAGAPAVVSEHQHGFNPRLLQERRIAAVIGSDDRVEVGVRERREVRVVPRGLDDHFVMAETRDGGAGRAG